MAKAHKRYRGVDLVARRDKFGEIYVWLYRRHDALLRDLMANTPAFWAVNARKMAGDGVRSIHDRVPSADAVRKAWFAVARHHPEDALRYAAARETNTGHVSRRHKGWVPTSRDPLPPAPPPVSPPPVRAALPITSHVQQTPSVTPRPDGHVPHATTVVRVHLTGDDPLADLTAEEAAALAPFEGSPRESLLSALNTIRRMAHMDRHNKPSK